MNEYTEKAIKQSLFELCNELGLSHVSISDLSKKADISSGTFSLFYPNLNTLIQEVENDLLDEFRQISAMHIYLDGMDKGLWYRSAIKPLFHQAKKNLPWLSVLLGSRGDPTFVYKLRKFIWTDNKKKHDQGHFNWDNTTLEFFVASSEGMFLHWVETGAQLDVENFTDQVCSSLGVLLNSRARYKSPY